MKTRNGGQEAKAGFWWNTTTWEMTLVKATGDRLPGGDTAKYLRVPTFALVLLGPVMGALLVMFLPFIGFAMLFGAISTKLGKSVAAAGRSLADAMRFGHARPATPTGAPAPKRGGNAGDDEDPAPGA